MSRHTNRSSSGKFSKIHGFKFNLRPDHKGVALALVLMLGALIIAYYFGSPQ